MGGGEFCLGPEDGWPPYIASGVLFFSLSGMDGAKERQTEGGWTGGVHEAKAAERGGQRGAPTIARVGGRSNSCCTGIDTKKGAIG